MLTAVQSANLRAAQRGEQKTALQGKGQRLQFKDEENRVANNRNAHVENLRQIESQIKENETRNKAMKQAKMNYEKQMARQSEIWIAGLYSGVPMGSKSTKNLPTATSTNKGFRF